MDTGVIGYGVTGGATAELLRRLGHKVLVTDTNPTANERAQADGYQLFEHNTKLDVIFLCVPETEVEGAVGQMPGCPLIVIRSSVPPGTTDRLSELLGLPLAHMPEFLKESTALWDVLNPNFILIGSRNQGHCDTLTKLFEPLLVPVITVSPPTSEMQTNPQLLSPYESTALWDVLNPNFILIGSRNQGHCDTLTKLSN